MSKIKITHAKLCTSGNGTILHGVVDSASIVGLRVGRYHRGILSKRFISELMQGFTKPGGVPGIDLGMRGNSFVESGNSTFFLNDPVYIIDGLQRQLAALELIANGIQPHLPATIHFGTTEAMENKRFGLLNSTCSKLSSRDRLRTLDLGETA